LGGGFQSHLENRKLVGSFYEKEEDAILDDIRTGITFSEEKKMR